jgi:hypothetical protein
MQHRLAMLGPADLTAAVHCPARAYPKLITGCTAHKGKLTGWQSVYIVCEKSTTLRRGQPV